jgi:hypothetical protein
MASEQRIEEEAPSYVRWGPEHSACAIELKLDLVGTISHELGPAERLDIEIGGVLIGRVVKGEPTTLRIEEVQMIPRRPEDGAIFMLGPDYQKRFPEVRAAAKARHKVAVGFFRSHCRSGPLRPSLADRTLLGQEFKDGNYVFLVIESREPHRSAFFVAEGGELPNDPSVREFRFNEAEFKALPEVEAEDGGRSAEQAGPKAQGDSNWYAWVAGAVGLVLAIAFWLAAGRSGGSSWFQPGSKQLELKLAHKADLLNISWNHDARQIGPASVGTLLIVDGPSRREIKLSADELKVGNVEYDSSGRPVAVTMTLNNPESAPISDSASWPAR